MTFNHVQTRQVSQGTLLAGNSRYAIVSELKIASKTVYNIVEKLVYGGYIRQMPGTRSFIIYEEVISPTLNPYGGVIRRKMAGTVSYSQKERVD